MPSVSIPLAAGPPPPGAPVPEPVQIDPVPGRFLSARMGMDIKQVWQPGKFRAQVQARSLLCYWAVRELGESMTAIAGRLGISTPAVSKAVARGAVIAEQKGYKIVPN